MMTREFSIETRAILFVIFASVFRLIYVSGLNLMPDEAYYFSGANILPSHISTIRP